MTIPNYACSFRQFRQAFVIGRTDESLRGQAPYSVVVVYIFFSFINTSEQFATIPLRSSSSGIERQLTNVGDERSACHE